MHNICSCSPVRPALGGAAPKKMNILRTASQIAMVGMLAVASVQTHAQTWQTVVDFDSSSGQGIALLIDPFSADASQPGIFLGGQSATQIGGKIVHYETSTEELNLCDLSKGAIQRFASDTFGNLYAVGTHTLENRSKWLVMKSSDGGASWDVIDNGAEWFQYTTVANGVTVDPNGNVFVSGYSFDKKGVYAWRVRKGTEIAGEFVWSNTLTIADKLALGEEILYVPPAPGKHSGGIYAVGGRTPNSTTQWTVMRSTDGGASWQMVDKWNPTRTAAAANAIATDPEGNLYVVGYTSGRTTAWHVRRSTNGGAKWESLEDSGDSTGSYNQALAVATDAGGNVFVAGYTGAEGRVNWTVRCWSAVTQQWDDWSPSVRYPMSPVTSRAQGLAVTAAGDVYVTGYANGYGWLVQKLMP